tara:strand:+ start:1966 stop:2106 length:141 start_codon:yes stop_codon:yes gene_type:complete
LGFAGIHLLLDFLHLRRTGGGGGGGRGGGNLDPNGSSGLTEGSFNK